MAFSYMQEMFNLGNRVCGVSLLFEPRFHSLNAFVPLGATFSFCKHTFAFASDIFAFESDGFARQKRFGLRSDVFAR